MENDLGSIIEAHGKSKFTFQPEEMSWSGVGW